MKANLDDLRGLAEDVSNAIDRHTDAIRANPDIAVELMKVRDHIRAKYERIGEGRSHP